MSSEPHVAPEDIARLAEGGSPPEQAEPMLAHFSRCRSCMAAYAEAVRYRAAWLAERKAFEPPGDVLARARGAVRHATPARRQWPRRLLRLAPTAAAVALMVVLVVRLGRPPGTTRESLPPPVAQALAKRTLAGGLFVPGTEAVHVDASDTLRGSADQTVTSNLEDSLLKVYTQAQAGPSRERAGYCFASALTVRGRERDALELVGELLKDDPRNCACMSLAAHLEYQRSRLDRAERQLSTAVAAGCRDDVTRINLAIVQQALGDTAEARRTFVELANRVDALGERAREELGRSAATH
jgi:hypothetical protein